MIRELIDTDLEAVAGGTPSFVLPISANFLSQYADQSTTITQTATSGSGPAFNVVGSAGNSSVQGALQSAGF
jgi:hypothetical protein